MAAEIISFSTQKGGAGKTLVSIVFANAMHFQYNKKVLYLDGDYNQGTSKKIRENDIKFIENNSRLSEQYQQLTKPAFPIEICKLENIALVCEKYKNDYDIIIIDLPGTLLEKKILEVFKVLTYVFVPFEADIGTIKSSLDFLITFTNTILQIQGASLKGRFAYWNKHKRTIRQDIFENTSQLLEQNGIVVLNTKIDDREIYRSIFCRNTLLPYTKEIEGMDIHLFVKEVYQLIFKEENGKN